MSPRNTPRVVEANEPKAYQEAELSQISRRSAIRQLAQIGVLTAFGSCLCGCRSAPVTGRKQLLIVPEAQEITLGAQAFQETVQTEQLSQNSQLSELVNRVGQRIADVAQRNDYQWDFKLLDSPTQNAFCLPGGKVAVYEGILPVCQDEAGLAVVMSHEIAHALARHGGERMSQNMAVDGVKRVAERLAGAYVPDKAGLIMQAYGVGSKYGVLLPYSRAQESEADQIGVMLMAQAGYDPRVAPAFWTRFGAQKDAAGQTPEFMSTHPNDSRRSADLEGWMDRAVAEYEQAAEHHGRGVSFVRT